MNLKQRLSFLLVLFVMLGALTGAITVNGQAIKMMLENLSSDPTAYVGRVYFNTSTKKPKIYNGLVWSELGSGGGGGEKNYITGSSTASGWTCVGDLDVATSTTASDLPRENTTATGIKITADSNTQSVADYCYHDFTLDDVDLSRKLKAQWAMKTTGTYTAGQLAFGFTTQADRTTFIHTPLVTDIPSADGSFLTSFDTASTAPLSLVIRATSDMTTNGGVVLSDVIVGPGQIAQMPVVTKPESWTPATTTVTSNITVTGKKWRVGSFGFYDVFITFTGTNTQGILAVTMPTGETIDTSAVLDTSAAGAELGRVSVRNSDGAAFYAGSVVYQSTTSVRAMVYRSDSTNVSGEYVTTATPTPAITSYQSGDTIHLTWSAPIAEFAGGVVNAAGQNDIEYACSTDTTDADAGASWTSYSPAGCTFPGAALTSRRDKTVRFKYAPQIGDKVVLEWQSTVVSASSAWTEINGCAPFAQINVCEYNIQNGATYGIGIRAGSATTTDVIVSLGQYAGNNSTYGAAGSAWSGTTDNGNWRLKKIPASMVNGFQYADAVSAGLVSTGTQTFAGAKTIGAPITGNSNGSAHFISGGLNAANVTSTNSSGEFVIGSNVNIGDYAASSRIDTTTGGMGILLSNRTSDASAAFGIYANAISEATTADASEIFNMAQNGAAQFSGQSENTGSNVSIISDGANARPILLRLNSSTLSGKQLILAQSDYGASDDQKFSVTIDGAITSGSSNNTVGASNLFIGGSNSTSSSTDFVMRIRNNFCSGTSCGQVIFQDDGGSTVGSISSNGSANTTAYGTSSDARLKTDPESIEDALGITAQMKPKKYERVSAPGVKEYGFYAQELNEVLPQAVIVGGDDPNVAPWQIDYGKVTPIAIAAIQELKVKLDELKTEFAAYKEAHP